MAKVAVEWVDRLESTGRATVISSGGAVTVIPVPDDLWLCDLCNEEIRDIRLIPVVAGYALCRSCARKWYKFDPAHEFPAYVNED